MRTKRTATLGLRYLSFPRCNPIDPATKRVVDCFQRVHANIDSRTHLRQESDEALAKVAQNLMAIGYRVETGKKAAQKIIVPVLMGVNGSVEKKFNADAYNENEHVVVEVEAGQAFVNFRFLKDIFEACMMPTVEHLVIAVRNIYQKGDDFEKVCTYLETLYVNGRLKLPLKSVVVIGY